MPKTTPPKTNKKPTPKSKSKQAALPHAAAKEALNQATTAITRMQKDASRNVWAIGRRLSQVAELKLYQAGGFDTLEAYVEAKLKITRQTAYQYVRVAEAFSEEVAATFGPEKLDRALRYIAATPEDEKPSDIPELRIPVPADDGATAHTKAFADVTVSELRRATQAAAETKGAKKARDKGLPEGFAATLAKANRALDQAVGSKAAKGAEIRARASGGDVLIDLRGIPLDKAAATLRALAALLR